MGLFKKDAPDAEKVAALEGEIERLGKENARLQNENKAFDATNKELLQKINEVTDIKNVTKGELKAAPSFSDKQFTVDGQTYGFNFPKTTLRKTPITVDDVMASEDMQRELVELGSGMLCKK
ncbi:MAG: hypothetical protein JO301_16945 [Chitinophagaceae bacterium]|nr:hypothetical protein [Chitinophagaceae bacterium]